jgi:HK97 family phage major capsid protein
MPYNNLISRADAASLVPAEISAEIIEHVPELNPIMRLARRLPNMSTNQKRLPIMSALATAYFVSGDTGLKQTSEVNWANRFIDAEELAVIVPIPEAVLDDVSYDIWAQVRPEMERAISIAITAAVLYGVNIPATWTVDLNGAAGLVAGALAAAQVLNIAAYADLYEAVLGFIPPAGAAGQFMAVEAQGYAVTGSIAAPVMRGQLRNVRDFGGNPIFKTNMQDPTRYELDGTPIYFPTDGSMVAATCSSIAGQWDQLVYSMRQDITYKVLTEAVIQDAGGAIVYNLAQQDMVALRAVIRLGFALPNPPSRMNAGPAVARFPFCVLIP